MSTAIWPAWPGSVVVCEICEENGEIGVGVVRRDYWASDSGMPACEGLALAAVTDHQFCIA